MHRHAAWPGSDDAAYRAEVVAEMDANNIALSVLHISSADDLGHWLAEEPTRFLAGPMMPCPPRTADVLFCFNEEGGWPEIDWLEGRLASGEISLLGEMLFVYAGISPTDPRMEEYWALASQYDAPVAVHINRGPPVGSPPRLEGCCAEFDGDMGNPALLRPILEAHPDLRVYLQHAGIPAIPGAGDIDYTQETFALLKDFPNVYVDMTILNSLLPIGAHEGVLMNFIGQGFGDRIMFGTDNLPAKDIIDRLHSFEGLSDEQRRAILYDNAARFFRLDQATIDRHYGR